MRKKFKHLIFALLVIPSILIAGYFTYVEAASISSTNFNVLNPIISNGLGSVSSLNFGLGSSIGQVVIGKSASSNFQLWSGYQYFTQPVQFTLLGSSVSNTTGAVSLQWTTPTIRNGAPITGYEVGVGSNPYLFTFQNVGNK